MLELHTFYTENWSSQRNKMHIHYSLLYVTKKKKNEKNTHETECIKLRFTALPFSWVSHIYMVLKRMRKRAKVKKMWHYCCRFKVHVLNMRSKAISNEIDYLTSILKNWWNVLLYIFAFCISYSMVHVMLKIAIELNHFYSG